MEPDQFSKMRAALDSGELTIPTLAELREAAALVAVLEAKVNEAFVRLCGSGAASEGTCEDPGEPPRFPPAGPRRGQAGEADKPAARGVTGCDSPTDTPDTARTGAQGRRG